MNIISFPYLNVQPTKNTRLQSRKRVDNHIKSGYNKNRKGVTGKRFAQIEQAKRIAASFGREGGYLFLFIVTHSVITAIKTKQN